MHRTFARARRAFTLIELLVVVAIIALLIAILLPSLGKARSLAKRSRCLANTRAIATSLKTYSADWNCLLPYISSSDAAFINLYWTNLLVPYGNVEKVRQCPEAYVTNTGSGVSGTAHMPWSTPGGAVALGTGAYGLNGWIYQTNSFDSAKMLSSSTASAAPTAAECWAWPLTRSESLIPMIADSTYANAWPHMTDAVPTAAGLETGPVNASVKPDQIQRFCIARHDKTINVAYMDGHGENTPLGQLWALQWSATWTNTTPKPIP